MAKVVKTKRPRESLLTRYSLEGAYTDCYMTVVNEKLSLEKYVVAFYTTLLFKIERLILKWFVDKPSTDYEARQLAQKEIDKFAAWHLEGRNENQILMCDFQHRTRSWFMVEEFSENDKVKTRLYFGSAVVPMKKKSNGSTSLGFIFTLLLGFHKLYSRALLASARMRLTRQLKKRQ